MIKICLLVSGSLGFEILQQIHGSNFVVSCVFTDKASDVIINFCRNYSIKTFIGNPRTKRTSAFLNDINSDLLLSVNYLFIVNNDLIHHPSLYAINIHGSLLPKYRGRTPHVWAIINGEKETGITAHLIDSKVDNGRIIRQVTIPILEDETGYDILIKFNMLYPKIIFDILDDVEKESIKSVEQDNSRATYFGKRTPNDGMIDWGWQKQRIRNWIRAQAKPYPGAFTSFDKTKIVIHKCTFDSLGYKDEDPNGVILDINDKEIYVKSPNGVVLLTDVDKPLNLNLTKGDILG